MVDIGITPKSGAAQDATSSEPLRDYSAFIAGEWRELKDRDKIFSKDPSTEQDWYSIPSCSACDVDEAVQAAHHAFLDGPWSRFRPLERGKVVRAMADVVVANAG